MGWFGRNKEISENENPESEVGGNNNELSEEGNLEEKLDSSDRSRNFRDSLKVHDSNEDDGTGKLDTGNDSGTGEEPGPRERSLPEKTEGEER